MFGYSNLFCYSRTMINYGWKWIVKRIYCLCCAKDLDDLDAALPYDPYTSLAMSEDKQVIIELLNEYDD